MHPSFLLVWRDINRHKLRSFIGTLLIALPVALAALFAGGWYALERQPHDPNVQAIVYAPDFARVAQTPAGQELYWAANSERLAAPRSAKDFTQLTTAQLQQIVSGDEVLPVVTATALISTSPEGAAATPSSTPAATPTSAADAHSSTPAGARITSEIVEQFDARLIPGQLGTVIGTAPSAGEISLSGITAQRLHAKVGDSVTVTINGYKIPATVSGIHTPRHSYLGKDILPTALVERVNAAAAWDPSRVAWYVVGDKPVSWEQVQQLNAHGSLVESAYVRANPPAASALYPDSLLDSPATSGDILVDALFNGLDRLVVLTLIVLVYVLMITPIFTISAQRMRRTLALAVLNGAEAKHLAMAQIAHGLLLGIAGGLLGAALGYAGIGVWLGTYVWHVPYLWLVTAAVAGLGILLGLLAVLIPAAQAARLTPAQAAQARGALAPAASSRPHSARTYTGYIGAFLIGIALIIFAALLRYSDIASRGGILLDFAELAIPLGVLLMLIGALGISQLILKAIALRLPFSGLARLASRDALRSSHRTTPAVGAIMGVTIGATILMTVLGTLTFYQLAALRDGDAIGSVSITSNDYSLSEHPDEQESLAARAAMDAFTAQAQAQIGSAKVADSYNGSYLNSLYWLLAPFIDRSERDCYAVSSSGSVTRQECTPNTLAGTSFQATNSFAAAAQMLQLPPAQKAQAQRVWEAGGVLLSAGMLAVQEDGHAVNPASQPNVHTDSATGATTITITVASERYANGPAKESVITNYGTYTVPAVFVTADQTSRFYGQAIVSDATAKKWGFNVTIPDSRTLWFDHGITPLQAGALSQLADRYAPQINVTVQQLSPLLAYGLPTLVTLVAIGLFIFTAFVMAMASADMAGDYATLFAVGASPHALRSLSAVEGLVMGAVAVVIGIPIGLAPFAAIGSLWPSMPMWPWLVLLALVIPGVTTAAAALTRPRKLTLIRRFE